MENDLIHKNNWWQRNWRWFLPLISFLMIGIFFFISSINGLTDFAQAYADTELCQNAINEANKNEKVIESLGKLESIDKLAIMEGNSVYSKEGKHVEVTVRVSGEKGKGKLDISADKNGEKWQYKKIKIRMKKTGNEIIVR
jgi:hypothetical protein